MNLKDLKYLFARLEMADTVKIGTLMTDSLITISNK